jgi:nitrate/nitrite transporter NarK
MPPRTYRKPPLAFPAVVGFAVVDQWFRRHQALAIGFVTLGAPVGGIFFSLVLQVLFVRLEWKAAMVVLSCILLGFLIIGNLLVETRPTKSRGRTDIGPASAWSFLRSRKFFLFTYSVFGTAPRLVLCR